jgi:hypothetical protein
MLRVLTTSAVVALACCLLLASCGAAPGPSRFDAPQYDKYNAVKVGMSEADVLTALGKPNGTVPSSTGSLDHSLIYKTGPTPGDAVFKYSMKDGKVAHVLRYDNSLSRP